MVNIIFAIATWYGHQGIVDGSTVPLNSGTDSLSKRREKRYITATVTKMQAA